MNEIERMNNAYVRAIVSRREHSEIRYPFRNPTFPSISEKGFLCKICDHKGSGSEVFASSGTPYSIQAHIESHRLSGEW